MATSDLDISNHPDVGSLFHCTKDCPVCVTTLFCPCLTYGMAMNELIPEDFKTENQTCGFAAQCCFLCPILPMITNQYAFTNKRIPQLCVWWCCNSCYLCKLRRISKFIKKFIAEVTESAKANAAQGQLQLLEQQSSANRSAEGKGEEAPERETIATEVDVNVSVTSSSEDPSVAAMTPPSTVDAVRR